MKTDTIVKPASIRKFPYEWAILALTAAVVYLFTMYIDMNEFIKTELRDIIIKSTVAIEKNNTLLKEKSHLNE